jgi:hypothetical protein
VLRRAKDDRRGERRVGPTALEGRGEGRRKRAESREWRKPSADAVRPRRDGVTQCLSQARKGDWDW